MKPLEERGENIVWGLFPLLAYTSFTMEIYTLYVPMVKATLSD